MVYSTEDLRSLGTIMGIWAHPDDESWSMAGIMSAAIKNGQRVVCVTATAGEAGETADESQWPKAKLKQIRKQEFITAMDCIGVSERYWLDYQDGQLELSDSVGAIERLTDLIQDVQPNTIFTFEPEGITGHPDHKIISAWVMHAVKKMKHDGKVFGAVELTESYETCGRMLDEKFDIYFNTDKPVTVSKDEAALYYELPKDILEQKIECLRLQPSQTSPLFSDEAMTKCLHDMAASEHCIRMR